MSYEAMTLLNTQAVQANIRWQYQLTLWVVVGCCVLLLVLAGIMVAGVKTTPEPDLNYAPDVMSASWLINDVLAVP